MAVTDASQVKVMESANRKRERSQEEIDEMKERRAVSFSFIHRSPNMNVLFMLIYIYIYVMCVGEKGRARFDRSTTR